ncbi:RNA polymerase sigma-70 factor, ECF subfamily [Cohaesibacter sp. ES.047]|uniref:sigma-70 family RNA polymerase sigma factor n=1 Tax=Cohaesibacter sp. ES.047 TaxID=1798205 RepID=UPI000BB6918E|nr:sigma-70 family RNA polymerase sigma factor [Cohaesibacter sp. ES.047]SNY94239.1 RNA polymerase sigma-70 factor, ECF subfamily [Cohaesibacter sp. ES.047]
MTAGQLSALLVSLGDQRDRLAFRQLFDHFAPRLKSYYMKAGTNPQMSEELVQETFAQIWRKAHLYDPAKAAASTWIFTIARNQRIDRLRSEKSFVFKDQDYFASKLVTEEEQSRDVYRNELADRVSKALTLLPSNQAEIVNMAFFEDATHADIAQRLKLPLGTVKSRMRLAFGRLRKLLAEVEA